MRTLYACLGASMALHALAMVSFPASLPALRSDDATVLTALFASPSEPAAPAQARPRPRREPETPAPLPKSLEPAPVAAPPTAEPVPDVASTPAEAPAVASPPVAAAAPVRQVPESVDPNIFDSYRLALIDAARRYKHYPLQAMARGWEGKVEIRIVVDANGAIKSALVKTSSRYQTLDEQALDMVKKAAQAQPAPRGREFTVDVPVTFTLQTG